MGENELTLQVAVVPAKLDAAPDQKTTEIQSNFNKLMKSRQLQASEDMPYAEAELEFSQEQQLKYVHRKTSILPRVTSQTSCVVLNKKSLSNKAFTLTLVGVIIPRKSCNASECKAIAKKLKDLTNVKKKDRVCLFYLDEDAPMPVKESSAECKYCKKLESEFTIVLSANVEKIVSETITHVTKLHEIQ